MDEQQKIERVHGFETKQSKEPPSPKYFEDFVLGEVMRTPTFEASEEEIVWFAERYDPQFYHLDADRASSSLFHGLVAGGFQTAALAWALALRTGYFEGTAVAGIGVDNLRWLQPLRVGDLVHVEFRLLEGRRSRSKPELATTRFGYEVINQRGEVILRSEIIQMIKCRSVVS